jgi:glutamate--cysteine ligase
MVKNCKEFELHFLLFMETKTMRADWKKMLRGVEKESLRTDMSGILARTPHPKALGSALTHPYITTDFSESQMELITGVHPDAETCYNELFNIQCFTQRALSEKPRNEMLWVSSMPCQLPEDDDDIPLGQYGTSHIGQAKTVYRRGLGFRYGRRMQTISGIHYNWSLPDVSSEQYFGLIRNFRRHAFLLLYLFGASPAVASSFVQGREHRLQALTNETLYLPHATSLRMGRLGYQSDAQSALAVSYNGLEGYTQSLQSALTTPYPAYEAMGLCDADGIHYRQLSTTLLQIENEFYGTIRPKRTIRSGERPLHALRERGVEYVEVRLMDLDPFEPVGITPQTMRFLDVFLLHCLQTASPPDTPEEIATLSHNQHRVAEHGREPHLMLERGDKEIALREWGLEIMQELHPIAAQLGESYADAVNAAQHHLHHPDTLPSARVLRAIQDDFGGSFTAFTQAQSEITRDAMLKTNTALAQQQQATLATMATQSLYEQAQKEKMDRDNAVSFSSYLTKYLSFP